MTDLMVRETAEVETTSATVMGLAAWAQEAQAAYQVAQSLAKTSFVP